MRPSRRDLLRLAPLGLLGGVALPRLARAAPAPDARKFLFVFVDGGWDPTWVFAPAFDNPYVSMPTDGSTRAEAGGLAWVSSPSRPSVDDFFLRHGARTCVLNGFEVRSIAHERCRRILLTGDAGTDTNDIPTRLAMGAPTHLPLAHVVLSGPAYGDATATGVVRVGGSRQLAELLDGSCVQGTTPALRIPAAEVAALEDAWVAERARVATGTAGRGAPARLATAYRQALLDIDAIADRAADLDVAGEDSLLQMLGAVELLRSGLARCAMVSDLGYFYARWDHHSTIEHQSPSYETLFANLGVLVDTLADTPGAAGGTLLDEVTVVVFSEMGRYPSLNASGGKDHWMTTSMMLVGGGVRGGQVLGAYDANMAGTPVVPETGELDPDGHLGGVVPQPSHLGATLLALAGLDPAEAFGDEVAPLLAVLDEG